jgi:hypothetical protein
MVAVGGRSFFLINLHMYYLPTLTPTLGTVAHDEQDCVISHIGVLSRCTLVN